MKKYIYPILFIALFILAIFVIFHSLRYLKTEAAPVAPRPTSVPIRTFSPTPTPTSPTNVQVLKAVYGPPEGFYPYQFTVKAGIPARLEVLATEDGIGCMGSLMVPDFSDQIEFFEKGRTALLNLLPPPPAAILSPVVWAFPMPT